MTSRRRLLELAVPSPTRAVGASLVSAVLASRSSRAHAQAQVG
jgi:hypothetical protein